MPHDGDDVYTSPIQSWIEVAYRRIHEWKGFDGFHVVHAFTCIVIHISMEIVTCMYLMIYGIDEMLRSIHWIIDCI